MTTRKALIAKAAESGKHSVVVEGNRTIVTVGKRGVAVALYEDGTAHRADVDLTIARRMTITEAARAVGL